MELLTCGLAVFALVGTYLYVDLARRLRRLEEHADDLLAADLEQENDRP